MLKFKKEEIEMEVSLKKRIEFICDFAKVKPKFINGNVINIEHTNLNYVEPHRDIIRNKTFLVFNYSNEIYIDNLNNKIKLTELENYLKTMTIDKSNKIV